MNVLDTSRFSWVSNQSRDASGQSQPGRRLAWGANDAAPHLVQEHGKRAASARATADKVLKTFFTKGGVTGNPNGRESSAQGVFRKHPTWKDDGQGAPSSSARGEFPRGRTPDLMNVSEIPSGTGQQAPLTSSGLQQHAPLYATPSTAMFNSFADIVHLIERLWEDLQFPADLAESYRRIFLKQGNPISWHLCNVHLDQLTREKEMIIKACDAIRRREHSMQAVQKVSIQYRGWATQFSAATNGGRQHPAHQPPLQGAAAAATGTKRGLEGLPGSTPVNLIKKDLEDVLKVYRQLTMEVVDTIAERDQYLAQCSSAMEAELRGYRDAHPHLQPPPSRVVDPFLWRGEVFILSIIHDLYRSAFRHEPIQFLVGCRMSWNPLALKGNQWNIAEIVRRSEREGKGNGAGRTRVEAQSKFQSDAEGNAKKPRVLVVERVAPFSLHGPVGKNREPLTEESLAADESRHVFQTFVKILNYFELHVLVPVQARWKGVVARRRITRWIEAAVTIQKYVRRWIVLCHQRRQQQGNSMKLLIPYFQGYAVRRWLYRFRKGICAFQAGVRGFLWRARLRTMHEAAANLQAWWRKHLERKRKAALGKRNRLVRLQRLGRGFMSRVQSAREKRERRRRHDEKKIRLKLTKCSARDEPDARDAIEKEEASGLATLRQEHILLGATDEEDRKRISVLLEEGRERRWIVAKRVEWINQESTVKLAVAKQSESGTAPTPLASVIAPVSVPSPTPSVLAVPQPLDAGKLLWEEQLESAERESLHGEEERCFSLLNGQERFAYLLTEVICDENEGRPKLMRSETRDRQQLSMNEMREKEAFAQKRSALLSIPQSQVGVAATSPSPKDPNLNMLLQLERQERHLLLRDEVAERVMLTEGQLPSPVDSSSSGAPSPTCATPDSNQIPEPVVHSPGSTPLLVMEPLPAFPKVASPWVAGMPGMPPPPLAAIAIPPPAAIPAPGLPPAPVSSRDKSNTPKEKARPKDALVLKTSSASVNQSSLLSSGKDFPGQLFSPILTSPEGSPKYLTFGGVEITEEQQRALLLQHFALIQAGVRAEIRLSRATISVVEDERKARMQNEQSEKLARMRFKAQTGFKRPQLQQNITNTLTRIASSLAERTVEADQRMVERHHSTSRPRQSPKANQHSHVSPARSPPTLPPRHGHPGRDSISDAAGVGYPLPPRKQSILDFDLPEAIQSINTSVHTVSLNPSPGVPQMEPLPGNAGTPSSSTPRASETPLPTAGAWSINSASETPLSPPPSPQMLPLNSARSGTSEEGSEVGLQDVFIDEMDDRGQIKQLEQRNWQSLVQGIRRFLFEETEWEARFGVTLQAAFVWSKLGLEAEAYFVCWTTFEFYEGYLEGLLQEFYLTMVVLKERVSSNSLNRGRRRSSLKPDVASVAALAMVGVKGSSLKRSSVGNAGQGFLTVPQGPSSMHVGPNSGPTIATARRRTKTPSEVEEVVKVLSLVPSPAAACTIDEGPSHFYRMQDVPLFEWSSRAAVQDEEGRHFFEILELRQRDSTLYRVEWKQIGEIHCWHRVQFRRMLYDMFLTDQEKEDIRKQPRQKLAVRKIERFFRNRKLMEYRRKVVVDGQSISSISASSAASTLASRMASPKGSTLATAASTTKRVKVVSPSPSTSTTPSPVTMSPSGSENIAPKGPPPAPAPSGRQPSSPASTQPKSPPKEPISGVTYVSSSTTNTTSSSARSLRSGPQRLDSALTSSNNTSLHPSPTSTGSEQSSQGSSAMGARSASSRESTLIPMQGLTPRQSVMSSTPSTVSQSEREESSEPPPGPLSATMPKGGENSWTMPYGERVTSRIDSGVDDGRVHRTGNMSRLPSPPAEVPTAALAQPQPSSAMQLLVTSESGTPSTNIMIPIATLTGIPNVTSVMTEPEQSGVVMMGSPMHPAMGAKVVDSPGGSSSPASTKSSLKTGTGTATASVRSGSQSSHSSAVSTLYSSSFLENLARLPPFAQRAISIQIQLLQRCGRGARRRMQLGILSDEQKTRLSILQAQERWWVGEILEPFRRRQVEMELTCNYGAEAYLRTMKTVFRLAIASYERNRRRHLVKVQKKLAVAILLHRLRSMRRQLTVRKSHSHSLLQIEQRELDDRKALMSAESRQRGNFLWRLGGLLALPSLILRVQRLGRRFLRHNSSSLAKVRDRHRASMSALIEAESASRRAIEGSVQRTVYEPLRNLRRESWLDNALFDVATVMVRAVLQHRYIVEVSTVRVQQWYRGQKGRTTSRKLVKPSHPQAGGPSESAAVSSRNKKPAAVDQQRKLSPGGEKVYTQKEIDAAIRIQCLCRKISAKQRAARRRLQIQEQQHAERRLLAARFLQAWYRIVFKPKARKARSHILVLQSAIRTFLARRRLKRARQSANEDSMRSDAAALIVRFFRQWKLRKDRQRKRRMSRQTSLSSSQMLSAIDERRELSAVVIQCCIRRFLGRKRAEARRQLRQQAELAERRRIAATVIQSAIKRFLALKAETVERARKASEAQEEGDSVRVPEGEEEEEVFVPYWKFSELASHEAPDGGEQEGEAEEGEEGQEGQGEDEGWTDVVVEEGDRPTIADPPVPYHSTDGRLRRLPNSASAGGPRVTVEPSNRYQSVDTVNEESDRMASGGFSTLDEQERERFVEVGVTPILAPKASPPPARDTTPNTAQKPLPDEGSKQNLSLPESMASSTRIPAEQDDSAVTTSWSPEEEGAANVPPPQPALPGPKTDAPLSASTQSPSMVIEDAPELGEEYWEDVEEGEWSVFQHPDGAMGSHPTHQGGSVAPESQQARPSSMERDGSWTGPLEDSEPQAKEPALSRAPTPALKKSSDGIATAASLADDDEEDQLESYVAPGGSSRLPGLLATAQWPTAAPTIAPTPTPSATAVNRAQQQPPLLKHRVTATAAVLASPITIEQLIEETNRREELHTAERRELDVSETVGRGSVQSAQSNHWDVLLELEQDARKRIANRLESENRLLASQQFWVGPRLRSPSSLGQSVKEGQGYSTTSTSSPAAVVGSGMPQPLPMTMLSQLRIWELEAQALLNRPIHSRRMVPLTAAGLEVPPPLGIGVANDFEEDADDYAARLLIGSSTAGTPSSHWRESEGDLNRFASGLSRSPSVTASSDVSPVAETGLLAERTEAMLSVLHGASWQTPTRVAPLISVEPPTGYRESDFGPGGRPDSAMGSASGTPSRGLVSPMRVNDRQSLRLRSGPPVNTNYLYPFYRTGH